MFLHDARPMPVGEMSTAGQAFQEQKMRGGDAFTNLASQGHL